MNIWRAIHDIIVYKSNIYLAHELGDIDFWQVQNLKTNPLVGKSKFSRRNTIESVTGKLNSKMLRELYKNQVTGQKYGFVRFDVSKMFDSEDKMMAITQAPNNGLIASTDSKGLIKIWTHQKNLVREI